MTAVDEDGVVEEPIRSVLTRSDVLEAKRRSNYPPLSQLVSKIEEAKIEVSMRTGEEAL